MSAEVPASPPIPGGQKPVRNRIYSDDAKRRKADLRKAGRQRDKIETIELKKSGHFNAEMELKEMEKKAKVLEANQRFRKSGKVAVRTSTSSEKRRRLYLEYNGSGRLFGNILQIDAGIEDGIDRLIANDDPVELIELEEGGFAFADHSGVIINEGVVAPQSQPASPEPVVGKKRVRLSPSPKTKKKRNLAKSELAKVRYTC